MPIIVTLSDKAEEALEYFRKKYKMTNNDIISCALIASMREETEEDDD